MKQTCIYCGATATRWCDFLLGFDSAAGPLASVKTPVHLCDAPLCADHAAWKGNVFISGAASVAGVQTTDHCCGHAGEEHRFKPISADEAQRVRYQHRCRAGGSLLAVPVLQPSLF